MKLGALIKEYREAHCLSQRQFAAQCDLSNGYISILEKGINPNTGRPVTPTIPQLKKLADGMNISLTELLEKIDDMPIELGTQSIIPTGNDIRKPLTHNILRIAGRDGSYIEKHLTDKDLAAVLVLIDRLPDASEDL